MNVNPERVEGVNCDGVQLEHSLKPSGRTFMSNTGGALIAPASLLKRKVISITKVISGDNMAGKILTQRKYQIKSQTKVVL